VHMKMKNFVSLFPVADRHVVSPLAPYLQLPNLNILHGVLLVEELLRSGLGHVFLCPGSRCAPLTVAVARSGCPHSLVNDERGAAFMALGFARASGRCAAVIVSSGTAVANLLPAVVEANHDHVPLLLLTADRPPEARDTAANQTINQVGLLTGLRWFKDVPCPSAQTPLEALLSDASYAIARASGPPAGPVHLNIMLREPLDPSLEDWPKSLLSSSRVARWIASRHPFTNYLSPYVGLPQPDALLLPIIDVMKSAQRGILVVGALFTLAQRQAVQALANQIGWPLLPDACSGLRRASFDHDTCCVPLCDLLLAAEPTLLKAIGADVAIQVGSRLVSKRLQALLASTSVVHVVLEEHGDRSDPSHSVTHRVQGSIPSLLHALAFGLRGAEMSTNALLEMSAASREAEGALQASLRDSALEGEMSEVWVARHICAALVPTDPLSNELLFSSNSLPIRHLDGFCAAMPTVLANRGASGIDGILHTALGAAVGGMGRCTLLVGDLATLHDLNALATARCASAQLVLVILNNEGGGIFRHLPIAKHSDVYSPYFDTPHVNDFEHCCKGFQLPYCRAVTRAAFAEAFDRARGAGGTHVIEVPTDKEREYALAQELRAAARVPAATLAEKLRSSPPMFSNVW